MTNLIGQRWIVYDFEPVKELVPKDGEIVIVKIVEDGVTVKDMILGDGNTKIKDLRGKQPVSREQYDELKQRLSDLENRFSAFVDEKDIYVTLD